MSDQQLMKYFHFDENDLYANQNGRFTDKQRERLLQEDKSGRRSSLGWGIVLLLVALLGVVIAVVAGINVPDWSFRIGFGIGFGVIWPLVWGGIGFLMLGSAGSKREMKLVSVRGRVNIVREESYDSQAHGTDVTHELHIGGHDFEVEGDLADVMMQGEEYILYYIDGTDEILSAEHIGKGG
jgi:hypothetical protein